MEKLLVTGGTGTIGSNMPYGLKLSSKDCDLTDSRQVEELFKNNNFEQVAAFAALVGGLGFHLAKESRYKLYYENLLINAHTLHYAKKYNVKRVISLLSSCIYSDDAPVPYTEDSIDFGLPSQVHEPYAWSKRMFNFQSKLCWDEGFKYSTAVPVNVFGLNDDFNYDRAHFVAALIRRAYEAALKGDKLVVWGNGKQRRNTIFTKDIVNLILWMMDNYFEREPLILTDSTPVEIGQVAELIAKEFGLENQLIFDESKPVGQKDRVLSGNKLRSLTSFKFTPLDQAIKESCDWFKANYPNIRL